jgi:ribosome maturation factor RimP
MGTSETLEPVVAAAVGKAGFELETLQVQQAGRRQLVKVVVDAMTDTEGQGIGLDEIAEVSRVVSAALDELEADNAAFGGPYTLEVTSPGLDRPFTKPRHWRRAWLRKVAIKRGEDKFLARVGVADPHPGGAVQLLVDGELTKLAYEQIDHAVIEIEFKEAPAAEIAMLEQGQQEEWSR